MKSRFIKNQAGFTLAEIMVAVALLGILSLAVITQMQMVSVAKREGAENAIINNLVDKLTIEMSNAEACSSNNNFYHKPVVQTDILELFTRGGQSLLKKDQTYGDPKSGNLHMSSANVDTVKVAGMQTVASTVPNQFILQISFLKMTEIRSAMNVLEKGFKRPYLVEIPINYIPSSTGTIEKCFNDFSNAITSAIRLSCKGTNSKFYSPTESPPYGTCVTATEIKDCGDGQYIKSISIDGTTQKMVYTCGALEHTSCASNQVITGFNNDGTVTCSHAFPMCASGQLMVKTANGFVCSTASCAIRMAIKGFNADGSVNCGTYFTPNTCSTYVTSVTPTAISCSPGYVKNQSCGAGQFIYKVDSTGQPLCANYINLGVTCAAGYGATGFDANGNITCAPLVRRLSCNGSYSPGGKNFNDCTANGGTVMNRDGGTNSYCRIPSANCPAGFNVCSNWGNSAGTVSCTDTNSACSYSVQTRYASGANIFTDPVSNSQQTATCYYWARNSGPWVMSCTAYAGPSAQTPITERGCY